LPGHRIGIAGVGRRFGAVDALIDLSFDVRPDEFVAVLGPSGCGKSTLLRLVAGLMPATSGAVSLNDAVVTGPRTDLGIVFQSPILMDWRDALGNVLLQAELRGLPAAPLRARAEALLEMVGLGDFMHAMPRQLSGGMRQRVGICRALLLDPPLLMMDEPFGALDALTREQIRVDLEQIWLDKPKTVLFITHSIDEAVLLADRVVVMTPRPGRIDRIIEVDMPRPRGLEARRDPRFAAHVEQIHALFLERGVLHRAAPALAGDRRKS
jgi:NitT/TauT family transport system ATP-binding protein